MWVLSARPLGSARLLADIRLGVQVIAPGPIEGTEGVARLIPKVCYPSTNCRWNEADPLPRFLALAGRDRRDDQSYPLAALRHN